MTDYFALLEQPRRPWLDLEQLKQKFHSKALQAHPDAETQRGGDSSSDALFPQLNEAYQVLQDPKRRLQHLLSLAGHAPDRRPGATPREIEELFPVVAAATHQADTVVQKSAGLTNALSRSLLKADLQQAARQVNAVYDRVSQLQDRALAELRELDRTWSGDDPEQFVQLSPLHLQLSYLSRWLAELKERQHQLTTV